MQPTCLSVPWRATLMEIEKPTLRYSAGPMAYGTSGQLQAPQRLRSYGASSPIRRFLGKTELQPTP